VFTLVSSRSNCFKFDQIYNKNINIYNTKYVWYENIYTIRVKTIENFSHPNWVHRTPHIGHTCHMFLGVDRVEGLWNDQKIAIWKALLPKMNYFSHPIGAYPPFVPARPTFPFPVAAHNTTPRKKKKSVVPNLRSSIFFTHPRVPVAPTPSPNPRQVAVTGARAI
jgi:hypothetical protein